MGESVGGGKGGNGELVGYNVDVFVIGDRVGAMNGGLVGLFVSKPDTNSSQFDNVA